ncbi:MAG: DUF1153 domain-containing protein [Alphaproteobacteria bacterium]|nr:DUF1153 domain-containing protein [Alphaproteobacteria bacterium]
MTANLHFPSPRSTPARLRELPPADTRRWVARRKAQVVAAVNVGVLTLEDACRRYDLSVEEFQAWEQALTKHGLRGLRTTRIAAYRSRTVSTADD